MGALGSGNISGEGKLLPQNIVTKQSGKQKRKPFVIGHGARQAVRLQLQGNDKQERASTRQAFKQEVSKIQRFPGQTFLEMNAISEELASDYRIRMSRLRSFAKMEGLSLRGQKNLDNALKTSARPRRHWPLWWMLSQTVRQRGASPEQGGVCKVGTG